MIVRGSERMDLPPSEAWRRLSDPRALGEALPALQSLEVDGEDAFEASFRPQTGLGASPIAMAFTVAERRAPERLVVAGNGAMAEYAVALRACFDLSEAGDGGSEVRWSLELRLYGVLRSLTQRVLEQLARRQVADVLASVQAAAPPAG